MGLTGPRLTIGEHRDIVAREQLLHDLLDRSLVELLIGVVRSKGVVVSEGPNRIRVLDKDLQCCPILKQVHNSKQ